MYNRNSTWLLSVTEKKIIGSNRILSLWLSHKDLIQFWQHCIIMFSESVCIASLVFSSSHYLLNLITVHCSIGNLLYQFIDLFLEFLVTFFFFHRRNASHCQPFRGIHNKFMPTSFLFYLGLDAKEKLKLTLQIFFYVTFKRSLHALSVLGYLPKFKRDPWLVLSANVLHTFSIKTII